jgi:hypothetical protein
VEKRLRTGVAETARSVFPSGSLQADRSQHLLEMTLCLFQGIALQRTLGPGRRASRASDQAMLETWREMVSTALAR